MPQRHPIRSAKELSWRENEFFPRSGFWGFLTDLRFRKVAVAATRFAKPMIAVLCLHRYTHLRAAEDQVNQRLGCSGTLLRGSRGRRASLIQPHKTQIQEAAFLPI